MSNFEQPRELSRYGQERREATASRLHDEILRPPADFKCDLKSGTADLTAEGLLPSLTLFGSVKGGSKERSAIFEKLDSFHDGRITAKEWVDRFDRIAGHDQVASTREVANDLSGGKSAPDLARKADTNADGCITMTEWLSRFQKLESEDNDFTLDRQELLGKPPGTPERERTPENRPGIPLDSAELRPASAAQVEQLFDRVEFRGTSEQYMRDLKRSMERLPASVVQAALEGRTRIVALGQGAPGQGGSYSSATNTITLFESSPFDTTSTLAAEMFHNWDLNPLVGRHVTSQPWFRSAFQAARNTGIDFGDNTLTNPFEFIHHMARYYSGITGGLTGRLMDFLGPRYEELTRQSLLA